MSLSSHWNKPSEPLGKLQKGPVIVTRWVKYWLTRLIFGQSNLSNLFFPSLICFFFPSRVILYPVYLLVEMTVWWVQLCVFGAMDQPLDWACIVLFFIFQMLLVKTRSASVCVRETVQMRPLFQAIHQKRSSLLWKNAGSTTLRNDPGLKVWASGIYLYVI